MEARYAPTHEVTNQPAPLARVDLFGLNLPMRDALARQAPALDTAGLQRLGRLADQPLLLTQLLPALDGHGALVDALAEFGVKHIAMPATPQAVWRAAQKSISRQAAE